MDAKSEQYLHRQTKEQREIIDKIRNLILTNFPSIKETGMVEGLWYEGKFYLATIRDHVNLGVGINRLSEEECKYFEGKGKSMRHLKFYSLKDIDEEKLVSLMKLVYHKSICNGGLI